MTTPRGGRRSDALSKQRIVTTATEMLDEAGEGALTFRALAARLQTGAGAIYWHVANRDELLAAATENVIADVVGTPHADQDPRQAIRAVALRTFDAVDAHPWVGTQLAREPWSATLRLLESLGGHVDAMGVPEAAQFDSATALLNYILGAAGQNAANARLAPPDTDRSAFLHVVAAHWTSRDPAQYPFVHRIADHLRDHDDREQFLAGVDLILAGMAAVAGTDG
ncbi:TetR/AcrR family transcriptional regulator [Mycobacterium yunnanensis]|uniref:TetR/AcrR family transcriptional regulator n=1 Tax=Mycobacterium yunnanensis TaxID=368477 RepID=A0A9X2ZBA7_9MYCO|nr:TetR/AcrR family transcriptional regulator [Mycobacterium yunnanensis]MCV7424706.1 TetR/AcrR family transcriptional regulator [Mycobacterium yunnanensis]